MSSYSVKDVEGVAYRADMDAGEGGLLVHWEEEEGGEVDRAGGNGKIADRRCF